MNALIQVGVSIVKEGCLMKATPACYLHQPGQALTLETFRMFLEHFRANGSLEAGRFDIQFIDAVQ